MEKYLPMLGQTALFSGLGADEIRSMLGCLGAVKRGVRKGEYLLRQGDTLQHLVLLAEGRLHIRKDDYWGNCSILGSICPGELFGEAYCEPGSGPLLNDVAAVEDSIAIFFDVRRVITTCSNTCRFHTAVVQNLFFAISEKNRTLVQKLGHMSQRTTREKLLSYLSEQAKRQGSSRFSIPFNRQQLADYLSVDRSAMSAELSRLQKDGLLEFYKNNFHLLKR